MKRPNVSEIMRRAFERHVLIPAFNIAYLPMVRPVSETLARLGTFGLIEVARPDVEKFGAQSFAAVAEAYRAEADPEIVALHLDHVPVIDEDGASVDWEGLIGQGLEAGYESVMVDGSRCSLDENIATAKKVVAMAHPGVAVEAELGAVLGHEAGPLPPYEELFASRKGFTDPDEAKRFVEESGVDWLSVAVGSIHGAITGAAKDKDKVAARLHVEHIETLAGATGVPLVLHGGSGIQKEYLLRGIEAGISKINIGTQIRQAYERALAAGKPEAAAQEAVARTVEQLVTDTYGIQNSRGQVCFK